MAEKKGPDADPYSVARTIALRQLDYAPRSRSQLIEALRRRRVPDEVAQAVVSRLQEVGLVDDVAFADMVVRSRTASRRLTRRALRAELQAKGIAGDIIDEALQQVSDDDERRMAREVVERKLPAMTGLDSTVRTRRLAGMLSRKGHSNATIRATLADCAVDLD